MGSIRVPSILFCEFVGDGWRGSENVTRNRYTCTQDEQITRDTVLTKVRASL